MTTPHFQFESLTYQTDADLLQSIRALMLAARGEVRHAINTSMLQTNELIAELIEEAEQEGEQHDDHEKPLMPGLAQRLKSGRPDSQAFFRNPYVVEFLGAPAMLALYEKDMKKGLLAMLKFFLLGLGKGFAFVAQQKHLRVNNENCFIDLVFYNYMLKCFVLVDLKVGKLAHQDVGQMDMYVRVFDEQHRQESDNPTLGLILCSERNAAVAKYSQLADKAQLFASKYQALMPTEAELQAELERDRALLEIHKAQT